MPINWHIRPSKTKNEAKAQTTQASGAKRRIEDRDICIFYYGPHYQPPRRKNSRRDLTDYLSQSTRCFAAAQHQSKSDTAIAYPYAQQKQKQIICLSPDDL